MTFEERLAEFGVDLSDLPTDYPGTKSWTKAIDTAYAWNDANNRPNHLEIVKYILHLTDIIDRMETRIVNLTGERDWLLEYYGANDGHGSCSLCIHSEEPCDSAACVKCFFSGPSQFERADVPEDWRVDDA